MKNRISFFLNPMIVLIGLSLAPLPFLSQTSFSTVKIHKKAPEAFQKSLKSKKIVSVSVKDFAAVGNGIKDDTKAIQAAIDAVANAGGGTVFFPRGIYKVTINSRRIDPSTSTALKIRPKVTLKGAGYKNSTIKLADTQGSYYSILSGETPMSDVSDFAMYDLTVDGNGSNNPVKAESDFVPDKYRYSLQIFSGSRIRIERCRFTNQNNQNVLMIATALEDRVSDVWIKNNIFDSIGGGSTDYDHSTIYTYAKGVQISNNHFYSRNGAGTKGARTAIEIHGDKHTVDSNLISGFTVGINVTGYAKSSDILNVTDNIVKEAYIGMLIWSYFDKGNTTNPAISNCTIAKNQIHLNIDDWRKLWGNISAAGIALETKSDAPIKGLKIVNNQIYFKNFSKSRNSDKLAGGVTLIREAFPNIGGEDIWISSNKIENPLANGIRISMPIKGGEVSNNYILNPGQTKVNLADSYRSPILVNVALNNVKIYKNHAK